MNEYPKVSVCIPTYNYGHFLPDAIDSVLKQTFKEIELIIVDNCSSDDTKNIVDSYSILDSRVKYYCNETNVGLVGNFNRCMEHAKGTYIKILCADDILEPACLEQSVNMMESYANVEIVSVARLLVNNEFHPIKTLNFSKKFEIIKGFEAINKCLLYGNLIGEPTAVIFRKKSVERGFDPRYTQITDLEMWFRFLEKGALAHIPETLCKIRQHGEQVTINSIKRFNFADEEFMLLKEYLNKNYVTLSFLKKKMAKYNRAYLIYDLCSKKYYSDTLSVISKHCNMTFFVIFLWVKKLKCHSFAYFKKCLGNLKLKRK
jgi:glycosyltransferase involved in cell wall biosynthesis